MDQLLGGDLELSVDRVVVLRRWLGSEAIQQKCGRMIGSLEQRFRVVELGD